jgi:hypothetical protein
MRRGLFDDLLLTGGSSLQGHMQIPRVSYGWAGSVRQFLETPESVWLASLDAHHKGTGLAERFE